MSKLNFETRSELAFRAVKPLVVAAALLSLPGCYSKHLVLQAEAVSMTQTDTGAAKAATPGAEIEEKWCMGDDPALPNKSEDDKLYGLADQVIYKAQDGGKRADFISDVRIYTDTDGCALLTGKALKI